jgi:hypothetical protein
MRRLLLLVSLAIGLIASGVAASAVSAYSQTGTVYQGGTTVPFAYVTIHNDCTGANGSTNSDSSGNFGFGGLTSGCLYHISTVVCRAHSEYIGSTQWYQPDSNVVENLYITADGFGC